MGKSECSPSACIACPPIPAKRSGPPCSCRSARISLPPIASPEGSPAQRNTRGDRRVLALVRDLSMACGDDRARARRSASGSAAALEPEAATRRAVPSAPCWLIAFSSLNDGCGCVNDAAARAGSLVSPTSSTASCPRPQIVVIFASRPRCPTAPCLHPVACSEGRPVRVFSPLSGNAEILNHGPPPAYARGQAAVGGAEPWPRVQPGVLRGLRAAAGL